MSTAMLMWLRPAGMASMTSWSKTRCCVVFCVSTIGDSPVTVTVSCERADAQVGVDRGDEGAGELDALTLDRR